MSINLFENVADDMRAPSMAPYGVVPHDTDQLPLLPKALYVGSGGIVTLRGAGAETDVVFKNVASGQVIDVRARYVRATGTTAADIVALA